MKNKKPKIFLVLKIIAPIMLIGGIILIILGTTVFAESFGDGFTSPNFALLAPGLFLTTFSLPCFFSAFEPKIHKTLIETQRYIQEENKEALTDIANTRADIHGEALTKTASSIKKGLRNTKYCKHCGAEIDADSKFCSNCGKEQ